MEKSFNLRDYLMPGGTRPYDRLVPDLEAALADGFRVYLWSVAGHFVLAGHQMKSERRWSDGDRWYKSAKDALDKKNGRR